LFFPFCSLGLLFLFTTVSLVIVTRCTPGTSTSIAFATFHIYKKGRKNRNFETEQMDFGHF
jgi:hypothetical protein